MDIRLIIFLLPLLISTSSHDIKEIKEDDSDSNPTTINDHNAHNNHTISEEEQLMDHLFNNYSKHVRPSITHNHTLNMTFGIAYVQLVKLDDREMTLVR